MEYISILPSHLDLSRDTQYLRLPHPRTGLPQLYLPTTADGRDVILEVVKVGGGGRRSWFIGDTTIDGVSSLPLCGTELIGSGNDVAPLSYRPTVSGRADHCASTPRDHSPPFQPLGDLISTAISSPSWSLPPPFIKPINGKAPEPADVYNEDMARLLKVKSVRKVFRLCCERKVVPAGPPSPPASPYTSAADSKPRQNVYYRPSLEVALGLLRKKLEYVAGEEQFEMFDHLVRGLSKDGLLASGVSEDLIKNDHLKNRAAAAAAAAAPITQSKKNGGQVAGEKRKAQPASRGVESLKKVNTTSMAKLTNFFKPKDGKK